MGDAIHSMFVSSRTQQEHTADIKITAARLQGLGCSFSPSLPLPTRIKEFHRTSPMQLSLSSFALTNTHLRIIAKSLLQEEGLFHQFTHSNQRSCNTWAPTNAETPAVNVCRNLFIKSSYLPWVAYWFGTWAGLAPELQLSYIRAFQKKENKTEHLAGIRACITQPVCSNLLLQDLKSSQFTP